uniref:Uncharacterized protein n=1 Tax=Glossina palpalis gambiensis TaxID=67801 RepID=A0A1B0C156_9MUSC
MDTLILDPYYIFKIWEGGMSFHVPFGLGAGRIGNFINGELWGRNNSRVLSTARSTDRDKYYRFL